jgi:DNA-directed RNA polymerase specialized sigma24 family protein
MGLGEKPGDLKNGSERPVLNRDEFIAPLRALSPADLLRLKDKAKYRAQGSGMEGDDLFQEAILRTVEGDRRCPSDVPVQTYLDYAMRSIADGERKKYVRERPARASQSDEEETERESHDDPPDPGSSPSDTAFARIELREVLNDLEQMFANDPQAQAVIMGDLEGWTAAEVKDLGNMDDNQYAAARKRVRRGIAQNFGNRG